MKSGNYSLRPPIPLLISDQVRIYSHKSRLSRNKSLFCHTNRIVSQLDYPLSISYTRPQIEGVHLCALAH